MNPFGGKGTAIKVWNSVRKIFDLGNIEVEVFRTQYYKHAYEHTLTLDIEQYNGIICCSGDGIVHEVINAIFHRPDGDKFNKKIPVGVIPGGSSNGFAKSICEESKEVCNPKNCSFLITKGNTRYCDLLEVESLSNEKKTYCFLSIAWTIIADCDLESEVYIHPLIFRIRFVGAARFTLYGIWRWMFLRKYYASLYYIPQETECDLDKIPSLKSKEPLNENTFVNVTGI